MTVGRIALLALLLAFAGSFGLAGGGGAWAQVAPRADLPSADLLRIEQDGAVVPYDLPGVDPVVVATADGGAWAFFSAFARTEGGGAPLRLYGARFDPTRGVWSPGRVLAGKMYQFGPAAVVDGAGRVHVVYADGDSGEAASTLLHVQDDGAGGWSAPVPVAANPNAGYQLMPSMTRDGAGGLHLLWRDQRAASPELRAKDEGNGDVFASDLVDGVWTAPVQVSRRPGPEADVNAGWPMLAADGDRLISVWSVYKGTTEEEMSRSVRVEWSVRPLADPADWSAPQPLVERAGGEIGGRLVAMNADPGGGVVLAYSRIRRDADPTTTDLFLRRLDPGSDAWSADTGLGMGDRGYSLSLALAPDGTAYVIYQEGRTRNLDVGAIVVPPGAEPEAEKVVLTADQDGDQGRATVATGPDGRPWVIYVHAATDAARATEIRCLRGPWTAP